jgi:hypothetical protein
MVDGFTGVVCIKPGQRLSQPFGPIHFAFEIRYESSNLAVIEYDAIGFVPDQTAHRVFVKSGNEIRRDMYQIRLQT